MAAEERHQQRTEISPPREQEAEADCHQKREILVPDWNFIMDKVTVNEISYAECQETAACPETVRHHLLWIHKKLSINIVHRIRFQLDVGKESKREKDTGQTEQVSSLVVAIHLWIQLCNNKQNEHCLCKTDNNILRSMYA